MKLRDHTQPVKLSIAFTPDGRTLITASHDLTLKLWDAAWGKEMGTLGAHSDWIRSLAISPNGKLLASCADDGPDRPLWALAPEGPRRSSNCTSEDSQRLVGPRTHRPDPDGCSVPTARW